jgi:O-antigen/teichoic acid export membrane protein
MTLARSKAFKNVIYASLNKGVTLVCIAVTSSVVARNLSPSDYGVIGFAYIVMGFLSHFGDMGVGSAVIRRHSLTQSSLRTALTLRIILSIGAFILAYSIAPFARHFFQHPAIPNVIRILAFNFLANTVGFMSWAHLTREQNYRALMVPGFASVVTRSALAITLILCGWKFWAVILADVAANFVSGVACQLMGRIPVRLHFDWPEAQEYLRFGAPLLGSGVLVFLILNLDNLLVGSVMGSARLGYYALAFTWGSFICGLLADTVNNVLFPAFSAIQHDLSAMRRWYLKTLDLVGFVSVIANTTLLTNAHFFLVTFLGKGSSKWLPAMASLQILCVYGIMRAMTEPLSNCIMALGRTQTLLQSNMLAGAAELVLLLVVVRSGKIELVALVVFFAYMLQAVTLAPFLRNNLGIAGKDLLGQVWPLFPAAVGGYLATSLLPVSFGESLPSLGLRALFTALAVALVHGLCTGFRCFQEASAMVLQSFARNRLARETVNS